MKSLRLAMQPHATLQSQATPAADHLQEAASLTAQLLGQHAKTKPATLAAGSYRGQIIAKTSETVLQRLSPKSIVVHEKDLFSEVPKVGANIAINYIEAIRQYARSKSEGEHSRCLAEYLTAWHIRQAFTGPS